MLYKLIAICNILGLIGAGVMAYDVGLRDQISMIYYFGYILSTGTIVGTYMLSITLCAKICKPELRGTMFSVSGLSGSLGILAF